MLKKFPQCNFSLELPEILSKNHAIIDRVCQGIPKIMHCGIYIYMPYYNGAHLLAHKVMASDQSQPSYHCKLFLLVLFNYFCLVGPCDDKASNQQCAQRKTHKKTVCLQREDAEWKYITINNIQQS